MAHSRGFPAHNRSRSKRMTAWAIGPQDSGSTLAATGARIWTTGVQLVNEPKATIVRVRGIFHVVCDTVAAGNDGYIGAIGLGLVSTPAFAAGIASVPTPLTEMAWDGWLYHSFFDVRGITATIADGVNGPTCTQTIEIDSKAMRIMGEQQTLIGVIDVVETGTSTMSYTADTRVLVKTS